MRHFKFTPIGTLSFSAFSAFSALAGACSSGAPGESLSTSDEAIETAVTADAGGPVALASGLSNPGDVAVSGDKVYFTNIDVSATEVQGEIYGVSTSGGALKTLARPSQPNSIVVTNTAVVFSNGLGISIVTDGGPPPPKSADENATSSTTIETISLETGAVKTLVATAGPVGKLSTDGANVFFSDSDGVKKVSVGTGEVTVLAAAKYASYATTVDKGILYGTDSANEVWSVPTSGDKPVSVFYTGRYGSYYPVVSGASLYWVLNDVEKSPPNPVELLSTPLAKPGSQIKVAAASLAFDWPHGLVVGDGAAYAVGNETDALGRVVLATGATTSPGVALGGGGGLVSDGASLYWTSPGSGQVFKLEKAL